MTTFKQFLTEQQDIVNNQNGLGAVPKNQDIDHFGLRVKMKPTAFLRLAERLPHIDEQKIEYIVNHLKQGGEIGAPYLELELPDLWLQDIFPQREVKLSSDPEVRKIQVGQATAKVHDHDGRHRMIAVQRLYGDIPIETHLFFRSGIRKHHIEQEWIDAINKRIRSQDGNIERGPLFEVM